MFRWIRHTPVALLGHRTMMVVTLQNHSGIPTVQHASCSGAATHIVRNVQQGAVRRRHRLSMLSNKAPGGATTVWVSGQDRAFGPRQDYS